MMREFDESKLSESDNVLHQFIIRKFLEDWQWDMIHGIMLERGYPDQLQVILDELCYQLDSDQLDQIEDLVVNQYSLEEEDEI